MTGDTDDESSTVTHVVLTCLQPGDVLIELNMIVVVSEVTVPSFIVVNLSNDGYFLPPGAMETERHLLDFLNGVLDGSIQVSPYSHGRQRTRSNSCV